MGFDFNGIKANLEGINRYLEANGVKLSEAEKRQIVSIFTKADHSIKGNDSGNGVLNFLEQNNFNKEIANNAEYKTVFNKVKSYIKDFFNGVNARLYESQITNPTDAISDTRPTILPERLEYGKSNSKVETSKQLLLTEIKNKGIKLSEADIGYWSKLVDKVSKRYNVSPALLITIISKETGFTKNVNSSNGAGPMGVTTISIEAFLPKTSKGTDNGWYDIYKEMDPKLLNDILSYSKSAKNLRNKCASNDEVGILIGLLTYELKYCSGVAQKLYGKANSITIPKAIKEVKNGYRLDKKADEIYLKDIFKNYNGSKLKESYSKATIDTLRTLTGGNYKDLVFIDKKNTKK